MLQGEQVIAHIHQGMDPHLLGEVDHLAFVRRSNLGGALLVLMLCSDLIHGDLSEFNVLVDSNGPVVIDLPQAVNAGTNNNAFGMLERDVNNMRASFAQAAPELLATEYAHEMWKFYQAGELKPDTVLTGRFVRDTAPADVAGVLEHIAVERFEAEARELRRAAALTS